MSEKPCMSKNFKEALEAVEKETDPSNLTEAAKNAPFYVVRMIAAANLQNQELLEKMLSPENIKMFMESGSDSERNIVSILIPALKNENLKQQLAVNFAENTYDVTVLMKAITLIQDTDLRIKLAQRKEEIIRYYDDNERIRTAGGFFG